MKFASRLRPIKASTTLDQSSNSFPTAALTQAIHTFSREEKPAHSFRRSSATHKSGKENSICNDFWGARKVLRFSRDYFMHPACTDLKTNRVC